MISGTLALIWHLHELAFRVSSTADPKGTKSCRTQWESVHTFAFWCQGSHCLALASNHQALASPYLAWASQFLKAWPGPPRARPGPLRIPGISRRMYAQIPPLLYRTLLPSGPLPEREDRYSYEREERRRLDSRGRESGRQDREEHSALPSYVQFLFSLK